MQVHIPLVIVCVVLCLFPFKSKWKKVLIMPICMLMITVYMAIRYDYGLDYWAYYNGFTEKEHRTGVTEPLFWFFSSLFPKYYMLIATSSILMMCAVYSWVKKYIFPEYYALFFMCFMCIPGMCFTMMTAIRTGMAFVVLSWGFYRYYINKQNLGVYSLVVIFAAMIHNSAIVFIIIPVIGALIMRIKPMIIFIIFLVFSIFSFTGVTQSISNFLFSQLFSVGFIDADYYSNYATKYVSNINGAILRSTLIFPMFFICLYANRTKDKAFFKFYVLSVVYMMIYSLSLDIDYRFTLYMFVFFIIALNFCLPQMNIVTKLIAILPIFALCIFQLYSYFKLMQDELFGDYSEGNFLIYETIFDHLPLF